MPTRQKDFDALNEALRSCKVEGIKKILQNFDITATDEDGRTCLMYVCRSFSSSLEVLTLIFQKIDETGSTALLKSQLTATCKQGWNCLMHCCINNSSSDFMKLLFQKITEVGNKDLLKIQLTATDNGGRNCLMCCCVFSLYAKVMKFVVEMIVEVGGDDLIKNQLTATDTDRKTCLMLASTNSSSNNGAVLKLVAMLEFHFDLFKQQYANMGNFYKQRLTKMAGIDSSSWSPDPESLASVKILLDRGNFIHGIHSNQHSKMKDLLGNDLDAKKLLDSKFDTILRACYEPETTLKTVKLLFSEIKRIAGGSNQYLKEFLLEENTAGETCLLSVCLHHRDRLELFLEAIEEVAGEEFLVEQISTKRPIDGMTCLFALCKHAPTPYSLSLLTSKLFPFGRRFLMEQISAKPYLECIFTRPLDTPEEAKILYFVASLYSITGLFEQTFMRCDKPKREILSRICNIESGEWRRVITSNDSCTMGDVIGEIKMGIKNLISKSSGDKDNIPGCEARSVQSKQPGQEDYDFL